MKLVPLFDRVVLKQLVAEETTKSGIVLPGQAKEKPQQAEVIAVGPGGVVDGKEIKMQVKPGDKVNAGDVVAQTAYEDLGTTMHSSIDGTVKAVTDRFVVIGR